MHIVVPAAQSDHVTWSLTDLAGRIILTETSTLAAGNNIIPIDISSLARGTYLVRLTGCDNCGTALSRFVKQ